MSDLPSRILEVSRDPLFKAVFPEKTTWVQTGRPLEPYGRHADHAAFDRVGLTKALTGLIGRSFDFAVFPAVRARVPGDAHNRLKATSRRVLLRMSSNRLLTGAVGSILGLGSVRYMIRDVGDFPDLDEVGTAWLPDALLYSKREVLEPDLADSPLAAPIVYTPMPFEFEPYEGFRGIEKTTDVFYAARPFGELRRQAEAVLADLASDGLSVDKPEGRIEFSEYLERMASARLVVSPRGQGEHCYRHYEALLVGSVPVINRPLLPVHYELRHGETCLFYDPTPQGLARQIREALSDEERLQQISDRGDQLVRARHGKPAICRLLLERAGYGPEPK